MTAALDQQGLLKEELRRRILDSLPADGVHEPFPGLRLARASEPTERLYGVTGPCFCVIAQGAKELVIGSSSYRYDPNSYLLATAELPMTGRVVEAPYASLRLELEPALVSSVIIEAGAAAVQSQGDPRAVVVSGLEPALLDAVVRLIRLADAPGDARVLLPLVKREIVFRLLRGDQGARLRHLAALGSHSEQIIRALDRLRRSYDQSLSIEGLARELGMSPSSFHHQFRSVTDMSPLQYQKQLRLQEARRLMLGENLDASSAAYRVGYDDPSHFSRDYKRRFGRSPKRDVERLRSMAEGV